VARRKEKKKKKRERTSLTKSAKKKENVQGGGACQFRVRDDWVQRRWALGDCGAGRPGTESGGTVLRKRKRVLGRHERGAAKEACPERRNRGKKKVVKNSEGQTWK